MTKRWRRCDWRRDGHRAGYSRSLEAVSNLSKRSIEERPFQLVSFLLELRFFCGTSRVKKTNENSERAVATRRRGEIFTLTGRVDSRLTTLQPLLLDDSEGENVWMGCLRRLAGCAFGLDQGAPKRRDGWMTELPCRVLLARSAVFDIAAVPRWHSSAACMLKPTGRVFPPATEEHHDRATRARGSERDTGDPDYYCWDSVPAPRASRPAAEGMGAKRGERNAVIPHLATHRTKMMRADVCANTGRSWVNARCEARRAVCSG